MCKDKNGNLVHCIHCGSENIRKNGKDRYDKSYQQYICKDCNKSWSERTVLTKFNNPDMIQCPKCGSVDLRKEGHTSDNRQRYLCKYCKYKFVENPLTTTKYVKLRPISDHERRMLLTYHIIYKQSIRALAKSFDKSVDDVAKIIGDYKASHPEQFNKRGKLKKG